MNNQEFELYDYFINMNEIESIRLNGVIFTVLADIR